VQQQKAAMYNTHMQRMCTNTSCPENKYPDIPSKALQ
jgi:hypothetical protein